jgi:hypothetical protein
MIVFSTRSSTLKLSGLPSLVIALLFVTPAIADIDTLPFTTIAFPFVLSNQNPPVYGPPYYQIEPSNTVPTGISGNGTVSGYFTANIGLWTSPPYGQLGFFEQSGNYSDFAIVGPVIFGPVFQTYAGGMNDSGTAVGGYAPGDYFGEVYGYITNPTPGTGSPYNYIDPVVYPGLQPGYGYTTLTGINDSGQVIGSFVNYCTDVDPTTGGCIGQQIAGSFLLYNGVFTDLPYTAIAINNLGQILGQAGNGDIVIDTNGNIKDIGPLPFTPTGFNDSDTIVGGNYLYHNGFLTQIQLQNETSVQINAINDQGVFVGVANGPGGQVGFETATPEPFAGLPLLGGIGWLVLRRLRNRRSSAQQAA